VIAQAVNLMNFLKGPKQFIIPIYQRTYSWTLKECGQLWDDIIKTGSNDKVAGHFVGSVVYIERGLYQVSSIPQLLVIDGQQRLTTISILLAAFGRALEGSPESLDTTRKKIDNYFLLNSEEENDLRYKLMLTQTDKDTLSRLIEGKELPDQKSGRIVENNQFFEDKIKNSGVSLETLYKGMSKLIIVDISLDRDHDNPQLIFESLNSTGLELSQADLIRNYILMGLEPKEQSELYKDYWYTMEKSFGQSAYKTHFDRFMRDYLTLKMNRIPRLDEVYHEFKQYVHGQQAVTIQDIVSDIYRFSKYFVSMALEKEPDRELREAICDINVLKVDVAYPLLLELYDDYASQTLLKEEFMEALRLIESYVFRRAICGIPTNSLNKTFATFNKELDKANYMESFKAALILMDSYRRFPTDDEFRRELMVKDLYNFRTRNYWLRRVENYDRKEKVNVEDYTIEHVMPQNENLSDAWQKELGENWKQVHERYLHTLGNLTLTGYNSELSDRPFIDKRNMQGGFADSPIRLNRSLAVLDQWNEDEIRKRAEILSGQVIKVWAYPQVDDDVLMRYKDEDKTRRKEYTLADHPHLTGPMLELFNHFRKRVMNLDSSVTEEILKLYIAYKSSTNFVDVVPQKNRLRLSINMRFSEIDDPKGLCKDVTNLGRWGNGDVEVGLSSTDQLEDVMYLVAQSFEKNVENGG
jgi:uncharacterized protein with ParB-like and HNH nuclease domain/predicted transport protein